MSCPKNQIYNVQEGACTNCPSDLPYFDGNKCNACPEDTHFDESAKECVVCPEDLIYDEGSKKCECPKTQFWTG